MNAQNNEIKAEQMVLYISNKLQDCTGYGSVVLNKVLFYADATAFLKTGKTISGFTYIKQKNGHTPGNTFVNMRTRMISSGAVEMKDVERFGKVQKRLIPRKAPSLLAFSGEEISFMDEVCEFAKELNATQMSEYSHKELGWILAREFEEIPACAYLLTNSEINENDVKWAKDKISQRRIMSNN